MLAHLHQYNGVLLSLTLNGYWQEAIYLYEQMKTNPEIGMDAHTYNTVVMAYNLGQVYYICVLVEF